MKRPRYTARLRPVYRFGLLSVVVAMTVAMAGVAGYKVASREASRAEVVAPPRGGCGGCGISSIAGWSGSTMTAPGSLSLVGNGIAR